MIKLQFVTQLVLVITLSSFLFGYSIGVPATCQEFMAVHFGWCDGSADCFESRARQSLVNSILYVGAVLGALLPSADPRRQLVIADACFAVGGVFTACAVELWFLVVGRLVSGVGLGIVSVTAPQFIAEVSPREWRGTYAALHSVFIGTGILVACAGGLPQLVPELDDWWWRVQFGISVVVALLQAGLLLSLYNVSSPAALILQNRETEARRVFDLLEGNAKHIEVRFFEIVESCRMAKEARKASLCEAMCDPWTRMAVFLGLFLAAMTQLNGINFVLGYSNRIFSEAGVDASHLTFASLAVNAANVVSSCLSSWMMDRSGRRQLLLWGMTFQAVAVTVLAVSVGSPAVLLLPSWMEGPVCLVSLSIFVFSFSLGVGTVAWVYLGEIYPIEVRSTVLGWAAALNWFLASLVVMGGGLARESQSFVVFGVANSLGVVGIYWGVVETKGTSIDDSPLTPKSGRSSSTIAAFSRDNSVVDSAENYQRLAC